MGLMEKERGMGKKKKRQKIILPPELPPEIPEDEIEVSDEDLQFVDENRDYAGFVSTLDTHLITRSATSNFLCFIVIRGKGTQFHRLSIIGFRLN